MIILKSSLKASARLAAGVLFLIYLFTWKDVAVHFYKNFNRLDYILYLKESIRFAFIALVWIWPLFLFQVSKSYDDAETGKRINMLAIATAIIWGLRIYWT